MWCALPFAFIFLFMLCFKKIASLFTGLPWLLSSGQWDADGQLFKCWHQTRLIILVGAFCFCLSKKWNMCFREGFIFCQVTITALSSLEKHSDSQSFSWGSKWKTGVALPQVLTPVTGWDTPAVPSTLWGPTGPVALPGSQDEHSCDKLHCVTCPFVTSWKRPNNFICQFTAGESLELCYEGLKWLINISARTFMGVGIRKWASLCCYWNCAPQWFSFNLGMERLHVCENANSLTHQLFLSH